nr:FtsW/RodA/SpoVE family cell cycle protein [Streptococcus sp. DD12]
MFLPEWDLLNNRYKVERRIDFMIVIPVFLLLLIGLVAIFIATSHDYPKTLLSVLTQQALWMIIGVALAFIVMFFSTSFLWKITPWMYGFGLCLMVLPLIFYSQALVASTGAKNWISIGSVTLFQPSEFMKIAYILMLARMIVDFKRQHRQHTIKVDWTLLGYFIGITVPVLLLLGLQKDLGTALVFMAIFAGMVLVSGISWRIILPISGAIVLMISTFLYVFTMKGGKEFLYHLGMDTYQINRISAWLDPFSYASGIAYQQTQGMISIGTGGLFGKGMNVLDLSVPVRESDMIFTVIGEDFGFLGAALILILYLILIYRMLRVTFQSNNLFYTYISTGFIMMIVFHIFENIGAAVGILPLTGIPLPFISKGGSSLISNLIGVGIVLSMAYQNRLHEEMMIANRYTKRRLEH